jgi:Flp pilus assembly protein TadB
MVKIEEERAESLRVGVLGLLLVAAAALVVTGVGQWSGPAALIVAGVLLAALAVLFLVDVPERPAAPPAAPLDGSERDEP